MTPRRKEPDTSRESSRRQRRTEGPRDERVRINPLYNTSAVIKSAADRYREVNKKPKKRKK